MKDEFSLQIFPKHTQITDFMKICLVEVELFHVDGQASMTKLMVAVHNSC